MGAAISSILSPAVGILISPFPIVGLILILLSNKARLNSIFYMLGWLVGNTAVFLIGMLAIGAAVGVGEPGLVARIVFIVLGALLILAAIHEFAKRPKKGEEPKTPKWFAKMSNIKPFGAAGFAFVLAAVNPKNMMLSLSAGVGVGASGATGSQEMVTTIVFVLLSGASIIVPTVAFLIAGNRLDHVLDEVRQWLIQYNSVIMSVLLLLIGISVLGKAF